MTFGLESLYQREPEVLIVEVVIFFVSVMAVVGIIAWRLL